MQYMHFVCRVFPFHDTPFPYVPVHMFQLKLLALTQYPRELVSRATEQSQVREV